MTKKCTPCPVEDSKLRLHPMHWENQPRWRRPDEVTEPGLYVFTRVDDDQIEPGTIRLTQDVSGAIIDQTMPSFSAGECSPIRNWDDECRFFGPIPKCEE